MKIPCASCSADRRIVRYGASSGWSNEEIFSKRNISSILRDGTGRGVFDFLSKVKNVNVFQLPLHLCLGEIVELALNLHRQEHGLLQLKYLEKMEV